MKHLLITFCGLFTFMFFAHASDDRLTILMYHGISGQSAADIYEKRMERFYADMEYIRDHFDVISLQDAKDIIEKKKTLSRSSVVITLDDGLVSNYTLAAPILEEFGFAATFFLITDNCGKGGFMSWEQIVDLSKVKDKNGDPLFEIGSHSCSHIFPGLEGLSYEELKHELEDSKKIIEQHIAKPCLSFALPYGRRDDDELVFNIAKAAGYEIIRNSINNTVDVENANLFQLPSLPIYDFTPPEYIEAFRLNTTLKMPFFNPVQDIYTNYNPATNSYVIIGNIADIYSYTETENKYVSIKMTPEDPNTVEKINVNYTPPQNDASFSITTKPGFYNRIKINIEINEPESHKSTGYFYVYFKQSVITPPSISPVDDQVVKSGYLSIDINGIESTLYPDNSHIILELETDRNDLFNDIQLDYYPAKSQAKLLLSSSNNQVGVANFLIKAHENLGVSSMVAFKIAMTDGVTYEEDNHVKSCFIYPNPATDWLEIKHADEEPLYRVYSISGQLLLSGQGYRLNVSALSAGTYIIRVNSGNKYYKLKFVKL